MLLTISVAQMDVHIGEPDRNLAHVIDWTAEAARRGSDVVIFPELWDTGYALDRAARLGSPTDTGRFAQVAALAVEHQIHIVGSMMEVDAEQRAFNTVAWFGPEGNIPGVYRKIHLFRLMDEEKYLQPGPSPLLLDLPWGKTGVTICYDLRFPELYRQYAINGALLTVVPAQWPVSRIAHWSALLRARAIENQMVVVGCNRVGNDGDVSFGGRSAIIDAWGEPVVEAGGQEALLTTTIDIGHVTAVREKIPVFTDRRPTLYNLSS